MKVESKYTQVTTPEISDNYYPAFFLSCDVSLLNAKKLIKKNSTPNPGQSSWIEYVYNIYIYIYI